MTVSQITRSEIEESAETAILPILSTRIPGLFVTERGVTGFGVADGAAGGITIRGIGGSPNTDVLLLIDGHPQYMGIMGHPLPDAYVASDAERVEVIRGPASVLYGSNAMGGVINIITKKQSQNGFEFNAGSQYGSYNTLKANTGLGYASDKFDAYFSINHDMTDGDRPNSDFDITNGYVKSNYYFNDKFTLMFDANLADFKAYNPGSIYAPNNEEPNWVDISRGKAALTLSNNIGIVEGAIKLFYNFGEHNIYDGFHSIDKNYGITFYQGLSLWEDASVTIGADYKNIGGFAENIYAMNGAGVTFVDTALSEIGGYIYYQQRLFEKLVINAGFRLDNHSVYGSESVPQAGLVYNHDNNTSLKASVSKGFRNPTIRELYMWNPANPDLDPQRMWNYEAGISRSFFHKIFFVDLTGFIAEGDNMIIIMGQYPAVKYSNSGDFLHKGFELETKTKIAEKMFFHANYSYLWMENAKLASPEHQVFTELVWLPGMFRFSGSAQYIGNLYTQLETPSQSPVQENYLLLNLSVNAKVHKLFSVFLKAENLLDKSYSINYGYPMPGTTIFAGFSFRMGRD